MRENLEFSEEQKAMRRSGVTGTDIAAVAGLSPWKGVHDVWAEKLKLVEDPEINEAMERGIFLEDGIVRWAGHRLDLPLVRSRETIRSDKHELVLATPDGFELDRPVDGERVAVVEVKSPGINTTSAWADPDFVPDGIPSYYLPQVIWEQAATGLVERPSLVAALIGGRIRLYRVPWDEELFRLLLARAEAFWPYVEKREPPPIGPADTRAVDFLKKRYSRQESLELEEVPAEEDTEWLHLVAQWKYAAEIVKQKEDEKKVIQAKFIERIRDRAGIKGSKWEITWKQDKKGIPNWKSIAIEAGATDELIAKHTREPGRRFLVKTTKEGAHE